MPEVIDPIEQQDIDRAARQFIVDRAADLGRQSGTDDAATQAGPQRYRQSFQEVVGEARNRYPQAAINQDAIGEAYATVRDSQYIGERTRPDRSQAEGYAHADYIFSRLPGSLGIESARGQMMDNERQTELTARLRQGGRLTGDELAFLRRQGSEQQWRAARTDNTSRVIDTLTHMPALGVDYAIAGGGALAARAATTRAIGTGAAITTARGIAQRTAPFTAAAVVGATGNPRLPVNIANSMADDRGVWRGVIDNQIEYLTEMSGEGILRAFGIGGGWLSRKVPGGARAAAVAAGVTAWAERRLGAAGARERLREFGWNGLVAEFLEERLGENLRGATGVSDNYGMTGRLAAGIGGDRQAMADAFDDLVVEGVAFSLWGGSLHAANRLASRRTAEPPSPAAAAYRDLVASGVDPATAERTILETAISAMTDPEFVAPEGLEEVSRSAREFVQEQEGVWHQEAQGPQPGIDAPPSTAPQPVAPESTVPPPEAPSGTESPPEAPARTETPLPPSPEWVQNNQTQWTATLPGGYTVVAADVTGQGLWDIAFGDESFSTDTTGKAGGKAVKTLRLVTQLVNEFVERSRPKQVTFTSKKERGRLAVYTRLAEGIRDRFGYSLETQDRGGELAFGLLRHGHTIEPDGKGKFRLLWEGQSLADGLTKPEAESFLQDAVHDWNAEQIRNAEKPQRERIEPPPHGMSPEEVEAGEAWQAAIERGEDQDYFVPTTDEANSGAYRPDQGMLPPERTQADPVTARIMAKADAAIAASKLTPETAANYRQTMAEALARMTPQAREMFDKADATVEFYETAEELTTEAQKRGAKALGKRFGTVLRIKGGTAAIMLDGSKSGGTTLGTYLHEIGHLVQRGISPAGNDAAWMAAYDAEIGDGQLTKYAAKKTTRDSKANAREGFAEFFRHLLETDPSQHGDIKAKFPQAFAYLEANGIVPASQPATGTAPQPVEVFSETVPIGEGHADVLLPLAKRMLAKGKADATADPDRQRLERLRQELVAEGKDDAFFTALHDTVASLGSQEAVHMKYRSAAKSGQYARAYAQVRFGSPTGRVFSHSDAPPPPQPRPLTLPDLWEQIKQPEADKASLRAKINALATLKKKEADVLWARLPVSMGGDGLTLEQAADIIGISKATKNRREAPRLHEINARRKAGVPESAAEIKKEEEGYAREGSAIMQQREAEFDPRARIYSDPKKPSRVLEEGFSEREAPPDAADVLQDAMMKVMEDQVAKGQPLTPQQQEQLFDNYSRLMKEIEDGQGKARRSGRSAAAIEKTLREGIDVGTDASVGEEGGSRTPARPTVVEANPVPPVPSPAREAGETRPERTDAVSDPSLSAYGEATPAAGSINLPEPVVISEALKRAGGTAGELADHLRDLNEQGKAQLYPYMRAFADIAFEPAFFYGGSVISHVAATGQSRVKHKPYDKKAVTDAIAKVAANGTRLDPVDINAAWEAAKKVAPDLTLGQFHDVLSEQVESESRAFDMLPFTRAYDDIKNSPAMFKHGEVMYYLYPGQPREPQSTQAPDVEVADLYAFGKAPSGGTAPGAGTKVINPFEEIESAKVLFPEMDVSTGRVRKNLSAAYDIFVRQIMMNGQHAGDLIRFHHELGHHLAEVFKFITDPVALASASSQQVVDGFRQYDYDPTRTSASVSISEGFAEWFRQRITGDTPLTMTPEMGAAGAFGEQFLANNSLTERVDRLLAHNLARKAASPLERARGQISPQGERATPAALTDTEAVKANVASWWDRFKVRFKDALTFAGKADDAAAKKRKAAGKTPIEPGKDLRTVMATMNSLVRPTAAKIATNGAMVLERDASGEVFERTIGKPVDWLVEGLDYKPEDLADVGTGVKDKARKWLGLPIAQGGGRLWSLITAMHVVKQHERGHDLLKKHLTFITPEEEAMADRMMNTVSPAQLKDFTEYVLHEQTTDPDFYAKAEESMRRMTQLFDWTLDTLESSGWYSAEQKETIKKNFPDYISLARVITAEDLGEGDPGNLKPGWEKKRMGSGLQIVSVLTSLQSRYFQVATILRKQMIDEALLRLGEVDAGPRGLGMFFKEVDLEPGKRITDIAEVLRARGVPDAEITALTDIIGTELIEHLGMPAWDNNGKNFYIARENGKQVALEVSNKEFYDLLRQQQELGAFGGLAKKIREFAPFLPPIAKGVSTAATKANMAFNPNNVARDVWASLWYRSEDMKTHMANLGKAHKEVSKAKYQEFRGQEIDNALWQLYEETAGNTLREMAFVRTDEEAKMWRLLRGSGQNAETANWVMTKANDGLELWSYGEQAPRFAAFKEALARRGYTPEVVEAAIKADPLKSPIPMSVLFEARMEAAKRTVDFPRVGTDVAEYGKILPFFKPTVSALWQEADSIAAAMGEIRAGKFGPGSKRVSQRIASTAALLLGVELLHWLMFKDEEWYKNMPPHLRYKWWSVPWPESLGGGMVGIPKPHGFLMMLGAHFQELLRTTSGSEARWGAALEMTGPPVTPTAMADTAINNMPIGVREVLQSIRNRDWVGRDIVPPGQARYTTSWEQFRQYQLPYVMDQLSAGLLSGRVLKPPFRSSQNEPNLPVIEYYERLEDVTRQRDAARRGARAVPPEVEREYQRLHSVETAMRDLNREARGTNGVKPPLPRLREIQARRIQIAKQGLGKR